MMKSLKIVVVACSMFAAAAWAQNEVPAGNASQQVTQTNSSQAPAHTEVTNPAKKDECVGPPSFCTLYFGS